MRLSSKTVSLAGCVLTWISISALAAEKPILEVNFNRPTWTELLVNEGGRTNVNNGVIQLSPGTKLSTRMLPYRPGQIIVVEVDASCNGVKPADVDYKVGWATLSGYDVSRSGIGHHDVLQIRGDAAWKTWTVKNSFNDRARYFTVELTHSGSTGTVSYQNLKISLRDVVTEELIGDSGFEHRLGADYWYYLQSGKDWDDLSVWHDSSQIEKDEKIVVAEGNSLRMTGPAATMVSKAFPYHGEKLYLGGWIRSENIQAGKTGWCGGGVQLVGLDASGKPISHEDLYIHLGTKPWTYYSRELVFSAAVKKVQVWLRMFDGAKGTVWFDEIRLQRVPLDKIPLPFDKDKAAVTIDVSKPGEVINHRVWAGVDALFSWWLLREDVQPCLEYLKQAGFEYIRFREISNCLNIYDQDDKNGQPIYNWTKFDKLCDLLVKKYQFIPCITISTTPPPLDRPGTRTHGWANHTAPVDFPKWGRYIEAIFDHVVQRYGKEEAQKWLWEIWNEPVLPSDAGDYIGSTEDFVALSEQVYLASERVEKRYNINLMIGLTSGGVGEEYILKRLSEIGKLHLVDHHSGHFYAGASGSVNQVHDYIGELREYQKMFPDMKKYLIGCTEWNSTAMVSVQPETTWNVPFATKMAKIFLDDQLDYSTYFALIDHPELPLPPAMFLEQGGLALFTRGEVPVPKPVYNAFVFLNELRGGKRIPLATTNEPIDGIATLKPDGSIAILLMSYDEDLSRQPYTTEVSVTLKGMGEKKYKCTRIWAADEKEGNSRGEWVKMGKPVVNDKKATKILVAKSKYGELTPVTVTNQESEAKFILKVPGPGIRFIELRPE
jgi:xylan 1,4-beta-xylosidase